MIVVVLVIVQGVLALLRANHWFQVGVDLLGEGLLLIPLMGLFAIGRGGLVARRGTPLCCVRSRSTRPEKLGMVGGINWSIDKCVPCLEPSASGRIRYALTGLGYRPGDLTLLPFQTLSVTHSGSRT
jgi:hypothetical protein